MRTTRITSALRSHCFEITLEGRTGGRGVAEQVEHLNHPPPISLGDHGSRSYRFLRSCTAGIYWLRALACEKVAAAWGSLWCAWRLRGQSL